MSLDSSYSSSKLLEVLISDRALRGELELSYKESLLERRDNVGR